MQAGRQVGWMAATKSIEQPIFRIVDSFVPFGFLSFCSRERMRKRKKRKEETKT